MRNRIVLTFACALLAGCWAVSPQLDPHDPPPNIEPGLLLLEIPDGVVAALSDPHVLAERDRAIAGEGLVLADEALAQRILAHQVVTGMSVQEVIWSFGCHPSRVRDQGPPGGHTLLWELPRALLGGVWQPGGGDGNYWVRIDGRGLVNAAGRN